MRIPDPRISGDHARLVRDGTQWRFEDRGSTNGSRVDGSALARCTLRDGGVIEVGHTFLLLKTSVPTPALTQGDLSAADLTQVQTAFATLVPYAENALEGLLRVARSNVSILLTGETGSGKEVLARAIHERSGRAGEFVALNCGALPKNLLEAQLFGHVKGAFSGATRDEPGYFRAAQNGTLFLDEIGDLPLASQAALLRALEEREVVPVGTTRPLPVDVRVLAATHAPLEELVQRGMFRNDLLARIAGFAFTAPPLRARIEELGLMVARILPAVAPNAASHVTFSPEVIRRFLLYSWPRNIRELKQCLASAVVLAEGGPVQLWHLPHILREAERSEPSALASATGESLRATRTVEAARESVRPSPPRTPEDEALLRALLASFEQERGNVTRVALSMGKARVQVQRCVKRFGIDPTVYR